MTWTNANWLLGLWLLPLLGGILYYSARKSQRDLDAFLERPMAERLAPKRRPFGVGGQNILLGLGIALFIVALAGPRFGVTFEKISRKGADIMVLLDTSRSMLAEDVAPNRLESAKLDIEDLLSQVVGDRVGLIAFAGKPIMKVPLTSDQGFFREILKGIDVKAAPRGGTAIGDAIRLALRGMAPDAARDQAIILITDGDDQESMPLEAAKDAAARGVRIYPVALGDFKEGERIPLFDKDGKRIGFEKYKGEEVWTKANRDLLTEIAQITGGEFLAAGTAAVDLGAFYRSALDELKRENFGEEEKRIPLERYQPFLLAGILLIMAALWISPFERGNRGTVRIAALFLLPAFLTLSDGGTNGENLAALFAQEDSFFADEGLETDSPLTEIDREGIDPLPSETEDSLLPSINGELSEGNPDKSESLAVSADEGGESVSLTSPDSETENIDRTVSQSAREIYNDACEAFRQGDDEKAEALWEASVRKNKKNRRLNASAQFNLGVLKAKRLEKEWEKIKEESDLPEGAASPNGAMSGNSGPSPSSAARTPSDVVANYRKGRSEREGKIQALWGKVRDAESHFHAAVEGENKKNRREAARNIEILRAWKNRTADESKTREREIRTAAFSPLDYLRWMEGELNRWEGDPVLRKGPEDLTQGTDYQRLYQAGTEAKDWAGDLDALLQKAVFTENNNEGNKENQGRAGNESEKDAKETAALASEKKDALEDAFAAIRQGSEAALQFRPQEARGAIRDAAVQIDAVRTAYLDYPALLQEAVAFQGESLQGISPKGGMNAQEKNAAEDSDSQSESPFPKSDQSLAYDDLIWRNGFIDRWTERLIQESEKEFARRPITEEEKNAENSENPGEENAAEEGENTEEGKAAELTSPETIDPEAKIRKSMRLALELGPEIRKILENVSLTEEKSLSPEIDKQEEEVEKLLQRIAEPLQDPNQKNQNQDNKDKNQKGENQKDKSQDTGQNQESQNDANQNQDSGQGESEKNENEMNSEDSEDKENGENQDSSPQAEDENQENQASPQEASRGETDQDREEERAQALMRKVRQRQQAADKTRKARDEYLRRIDKPEKDW